MAEPPCARIDAQRPLLRAGLERIARGADVSIVDARSADFVLRSIEPGTDEADLEIAIADGVCVITCRRAPEVGVWEALRRIITVAGAG